MKNILGLLHVAALFSFYAAVFTFLVLLVISFYGLMFAVLIFVMAKSYLILGNTWFFIVWPILLGALITFKTRKFWFKGLLKQLKKIP